MMIPRPLQSRSHPNGCKTWLLADNAASSTGNGGVVVLYESARGQWGNKMGGGIKWEEAP